MSKNFKILSIDGGGIKGLYSACILQQFEQKYNCKIADHFDLICGTSTGGLIALALSMNKRASDIADFYAKNGQYIFPYNNKFKRFYGAFKQILWKGKYNNEVLKSKIEEFIGTETKMKDASALLCIPSFNLTLGKPIVFKYPHKEGQFFRDGEIKMVDVALATSAAPTYFPIAELDYPNLKGQFIDGGVWANNPTLCGLLEALNYFVGDNKKFDTYSILSIASISSSNGWRMGVSKNKSFRGWTDKLFQTPLDGQNHFTDFFTKTLVANTSTKGYYLRIPSPELSASQTKDIELDKADKNSIKILQSFGNQQGIDYVTKENHRKQVDVFFEEPKIYLIN